MPIESPLIIGVDIGGSKVAAGVVDSSGQIRNSVRVAMNVENGAAGLAVVKTAIESVWDAAKLGGRMAGAIRGIGICAPGPLDPDGGVILNPPNLPCWRGFPLRDEISQAYGVTVRLDNDGNAAALAEALWGAGRGYRNVFYAAIGTGIGTGIIFDRRIYHGRTGAAGEGGHVSIDYRGPRCHCGKQGCIEVLASGPAIARRAAERIAGGRTSAILTQAGGNVEGITADMVGRAYAEGDSLAAEVLQETATFLSVWLGNIVDLIEPDVIVIGGGAAPLMKPFFQKIREQLPQWSINPGCQEIPIVSAHYGEQAGIAGAAALLLDTSSCA